MPVSTWRADRTASIDAQAPDTNFAQSGTVGVLLVGGSKAIGRRALLGFDLATPPAEGLNIPAGADISAADLIVNVSQVRDDNGVGFRPATLLRLTRNDWDPATCTWNNYRAGSPWSTPGGDTATPTEAFTSPGPLSFTGDFTITDLAALVQDAIANRAGRLDAIAKMDDETASATHLFDWSAQLTNDLRPRLRVQWEAAATTPVMAPDTLAEAGAPSVTPATPSLGASPVRPAGATRPSGAHGR